MCQRVVDNGYRRAIITGGCISYVAGMRELAHSKIINKYDTLIYRSQIVRLGALLKCERDINIYGAEYQHRSLNTSIGTDGTH